jgi:hypothetical protein
MQSPALSRHGVAIATVAIAALLLALWQLASPAPPPPALHRPPPAQHAPTCSPLERAAQVALLDKDQSPCPGHAWWEAMVETGELSCRPLTLLNVGANKGYTLSYFAALLQPSAGITSMRVHDNLVQHFGASLPYPCGACGDCHEAPPAALAPRVCPGPPPTLPQAHALNLLGFEPLMDNIEVLYYGLDVLFRARQGLAQGSLWWARRAWTAWPLACAGAARSCAAWRPAARAPAAAAAPWCRCPPPPWTRPLRALACRPWTF